MAATCVICKDDTTARILVLPCPGDHLICKDCLNTIRVENGPAIKCPECRKIFGWLDERLLEVYGGEDEVNAKQCCVLCMGEGQKAQSSYFCVTCGHKLCSSCNELHEKLFRGAQKHEVITFNQFRACPDKFCQYTCDQNGHDKSEISFVCTKCSSMVCSLCVDESAVCNDGGIHQPGSLIKEFEKAKNKMEEVKSSALVESLKLDNTLKMDSCTMEDHRETVENLISQSSTAVKEAHASLDELERLNRGLLTRYLSGQKQQFDQDKNMKLKSEFHLRDIQDGIMAILDSSHPVKLIQVDREVKNKFEKDIKEIRHQPFTVSNPELKVVGVAADNLVGLEVVLPAFSRVPQPHPDLELPLQDNELL